MRFPSLLFTLPVILVGLSASAQNRNGQPVHVDRPFQQDYSIKYTPATQGVGLVSACSDRNGGIRILSTAGVLLPHDGQFLHPGSLRPDNRYRTTITKKIQGLASYRDQFVLVDDKAVFSNAWAGSLYLTHRLPGARMLAGGASVDFLLSDGASIQYVTREGVRHTAAVEGAPVLDIRQEPGRGGFLVLTAGALHRFDARSLRLDRVYRGEGLTAFDLSGGKAWIGTGDGYLTVDLATNAVAGPFRKVPVTDIRSVRAIGRKVWFGTSDGAFALRPDGRHDYYQGERWMPGRVVSHIGAGPEGSALLLTEAGLGQVCFRSMTLAEKAEFYQRQVRDRHIRNGFNASLSGMKKGDLSTGFLSDSDNDGLWTSMYLGAEVFRYAVTRSADALANVRESLDAMERLYTINPVPGFPARSFERRGFIKALSDPERWQHAPDPEWDWKATTSSDEAIGHVFVFGAIAELVDEPAVRRQAITLLDTLMMHIIRNDWYLIDYDGKPTLWGKWNPSYVNGFPIAVGDRKLNSSNIVAMLQTAYRFTRKPIYRDKAFELMQKHGYLENLKRPMRIIGEAGDNADDHAKMLSDGWNHSDDEMYFLGYWGLYRYAFNDTLKRQYRAAIIDHWEAERPEKEGLWNIFTAITGTREFDLAEAVWYLQEHPLDLIDWAIANSHRKDIEPVKPNFRRQTIKEVLPPDERPIQRHNSNMFSLDRKGGDGVSEHSAGDIWLLPYWMGRYLGVISAPAN
jgi:hypothetical protein